MGQTLSSVNSDGGVDPVLKNVSVSVSNLNSSLDDDGNNLVGQSSLEQLPSTSTTTTTIAPPTSSDSVVTATYSSDLTGQSTTLLKGNKTFPSIANNGTSTPSDLSIDDEDEFSINIFGNVLYPLRWLTLLAPWLGPLSSIAMVVGCVMPYVPQYITIYKTWSSSGFSTFVCLTLLLSNILRIAFWFGHRFELPLLIQSVIQVFTQITLLELCIRVKNQSAHPPSRRTIWSFNIRHFWRWTDLASYLEFLLLFSALLGISVHLLIDSELYIEAVGYCALVIESMLGLPQVIKNFRKKSVEGMSLGMVLMWLGGDVFKTGYYVANAVPYQFWLCGFSQVTIDVIILIQVCLYRRNSSHKINSDMKAKEMVAL